MSKEQALGTRGGDSGTEHGPEPGIGLSATPVAESAGLASAELWNRATVWAAVGLAAAVLLPTLVPWYPEVSLDIDPRSPRYTAFVDGMGPGAVAAWEVLTVALSGLAVWVAWRGGARPAWGAMALAAVGGVAAMLWMRATSTDQWVLGGWVAGLAVAVAGWHVGQVRAARAWLLAMIAAMACPWLLDAVVYVWHEHPMMMREMRMNAAVGVDARGLTPGSAAYELFMRRAGDDAATGAIGLSNVFGSLIAVAGAMLCAAVACLRPRGWRRHGFTWAGLVMAAIALWLTESRGAMAVLVIVAGAVGATGAVAMGAGAGRWAGWGGARPRPRSGRVLTLMLVLVAGLVVLVPVVAVVSRGWAGRPEGPDGDPLLSLLFRGWYWQAGVAMLVELGGLGGLGAGGLGDWFPYFKSGYCPEDVVSLHNAVLDWVVALGAGGVAITALAALAMVSACRNVASARLSNEPPRAAPTLVDTEPIPANNPAPDAVLTLPNARPALIVAGVLFAITLATRWAVLLDPLQFLSLAAGLVGFALLAMWLRYTVGEDDRWLAWAAWAGALVVLAHGMIEMTLYQPASCGLAWLTLGLAAASLGSREARHEPAGPNAVVHITAPTTPRRPARWCAIAMAALLAVPTLAFVPAIAPSWRQAAAKAQVVDAIRAGDLRRAVGVLGRPVLLHPADDRAARYLVGLLMEQAMHREALLAIDEAAALGQGPVFCDRLRARVYEAMGRPDEAVAALERVIALRPHGLEDHLQLADLLWSRHQRDHAAALYADALAISDRYFLDPARQLNDRDRRRAEQRASASRD